MNYPIKLPPDLVGKPIVDTGDLTRVLPYCPSGIRGLVRKGDLPAPFSLGGKSMWNFQEVLDRIAAAANANAEAA